MQLMNNRSKINFNSIKVRLKLSQNINQKNGHTFQFHKGTIKTSTVRKAEDVNRISIP